MKKFLLLAVVALTLCSMTGCMSLRTPDNGPRAKKVQYVTFFGLSLESGCWGDGFILGTK